jgi:hypothetical protein
MALQKSVLIQSLGVNANYWRIDSVSADRVRKCSTVILAGYASAEIAQTARLNNLAFPLDRVTYVFLVENDPLLANDNNALEYIYSQLKLLPEWSDAVDV